jgi:hypothetical protein
MPMKISANCKCSTSFNVLIVNFDGLWDHAIPCSDRKLSGSLAYNKLCKISTTPDSSRLGMQKVATTILVSMALSLNLQTVRLHKDSN